jgi:hypothetical protein
MQDIKLDLNEHNQPVFNLPKTIDESNLGIVFAEIQHAVPKEDIRRC